MDRDVYNSLKFIRENDLTEHTVIEQYFVNTDSTGIDHDLKPQGSQILVTNENKEEFIRLKCAYLAFG